MAHPSSRDKVISDFEADAEVLFVQHLDLLAQLEAQLRAVEFETLAQRVGELEKAQTGCVANAKFLAPFSTSNIARTRINNGFGQKQFGLYVFSP